MFTIMISLANLEGLYPNTVFGPITAQTPKGHLVGAMVTPFGVVMGVHYNGACATFNVIDNANMTEVAIKAQIEQDIAVLIAGGGGSVRPTTQRWSGKNKKKKK